MYWIEGALIAIPLEFFVFCFHWKVARQGSKVVEWLFSVLAVGGCWVPRLFTREKSSAATVLAGWTGLQPENLRSRGPSQPLWRIKSE